MHLVLTLCFAILFRRLITDPLTAYKLYPTDVMRQMRVQTTDFEADHEMTAKVIRGGIPMRSVAISYAPRSVEEDKKIRPIDGLIALHTALGDWRRA